MRFVHDPAIYEDKTTGKFYIYCTGAVGYVSDDLVNFSELGKMIRGVPEDARIHTSSDQIWAPETRGRSQSLIFRQLWPCSNSC